MNCPVFDTYKLKKKFTPEEDELLKSLVEQYGTSNWNDIETNFPNRTARQLKDRWLNYLDPNVNMGEWTLEEEELLLQKIDEIGKKWRKIATFFNGRTDVHLKNRYKLMKRREQHTGNIRQVHAVLHVPASFKPAEVKSSPSSQNSPKETSKPLWEPDSTKEDGIHIEVWDKKSMGGCDFFSELFETNDFDHIDFGVFQEDSVY